MRAPCLLVFLLLAAGCSRPPSADTFTAEPLPSASAALLSPNGQRQALLVRNGTRWQGHLDDTFANTVRTVFADTGETSLPELLHTAGSTEPPVDVSGWRQRRDMPVLVVESWAAGDPSLRAKGPASLVSMLRVAGDTASVAATNAALAAELEGAVGLAAPPGDSLTDPGAVASRVAIEAATRAVIDAESGAVFANARMAVLQIPILSNRRFLAVEHLVFEDNDGVAAGRETSRFTLHNLETGESPDPDSLIDMATLERLGALAGAGSPPVDWYAARPGIVVVAAGGARSVIPWRVALPMLPEDSPLRAVADSVH